MKIINREIVVYLVVGVMTTIVSWGACLIARLFLDSSYGIQNFTINTIGWVSGVCFSYPLNRKWVFKSKNAKLMKEFLEFAGSRLSTWIIDICIMWFFVNLIPLNRLIDSVLAKFHYQLSPDKVDFLNYWFVKIFISSTLVIVLNYIFSKKLVFNKNKGGKRGK